MTNARTWQKVVKALGKYQDAKGFEYVNGNNLEDDLFLDPATPETFLISRTEWDAAMILFGDMPKRARSEWWSDFSRILGFIDLKGKNNCGVEMGYLNVDIIRSQLGDEYVAATHKRKMKENMLISTSVKSVGGDVCQ